MKVALKDRTQSQVERKIEFYRQIPIYPKWACWRSSKRWNTRKS